MSLVYIIISFVQVLPIFSSIYCLWVPMYLCLSLCLLYRAVSILMFISTLWDVCKFGIEIHLYPAPLFSRSIYMYIRFTYLSLCCASAVPVLCQEA